tara:strand:+ start:189 stop:1061 length:873 start_codon:yes stop_codon:yes gene_type:complete
MKKFNLLILATILIITPSLFVSKINRLRFTSLLNRINYNKKYPKESYFSTSFKDIVPCPKESINVGYFGQSNHGNIIERENILDLSYENVFTYDWRLGVCSKYKEPLVGVDGRAGGFGHVSTDTINFLKKNYDFTENIVFLGFSKGGTKAHDWAIGTLANKFDFLLKKLKKDGIEIDYVFWHQGESEIKRANRIYYKNYIKDIQLIFHKFLRTSNKTKIGMALVSICNSEKSKSLIHSQRSIIQDNDRVFLTLNTDNLGSKYRYDGCHFNSLGASIIGQRYASFINKFNK